MKQIFLIFTVLLLIGCKKTVDPLQEIIDYAYSRNFSQDEKDYIDSTKDYPYEMIRMDNYPFTTSSYDTIINYTHFTLIPNE